MVGIEIEEVAHTGVVMETGGEAVDIVVTVGGVVVVVIRGNPEGTNYRSPVFLLLDHGRTSRYSMEDYRCIYISLTFI